MTTTLVPTNGTIATAAPKLVFPGVATISISFKQPARRFWLQITEALILAPDAPECYRPLVESALRTAAKDIASDYIKTMPATPLLVPEDMLTREALLDHATSTGLEWMTKDTLTAAWLESATRKQWITDRAADYAANKAFRAQVNAFADDVLKLAAKNITLPPERCEVILAKIRDEDLTTPFGEFIVSRLTALKDKPQPEQQSADML